MVLRLLENAFVISKYLINLFLLMPPRNTLPGSDHHAQVEGKQSHARMLKKHSPH